MPVEAADEFERELLEVSALLASTVDRRRNQLHRDSLVDVIDAHWQRAGLCPKCMVLVPPCGSERGWGRSNKP
ncbi:hypothetical protein SVIOM74S_08748 [Streptomyces violarus]